MEPGLALVRRSPSAHTLARCLAMRVTQPPQRCMLQLLCVVPCCLSPTYMQRHWHACAVTTHGP